MIKKNISFIKTLITITFFTISFKMIKKIKKTSPKSDQLNNCSIHNLQDLADLFPKNIEQIKKYYKLNFKLELRIPRKSLMRY